jgi:hypothetical protein
MQIYEATALKLVWLYELYYCHTHKLSLVHPVAKTMNMLKEQGCEMYIGVETDWNIPQVYLDIMCKIPSF